MGQLDTGRVTSGQNEVTGTIFPKDYHLPDIFVEMMRARHWSFLGTGPMPWGRTHKPAVERGTVNCVFPESNMSAKPSQVNCTVTPPHATGAAPFRPCRVALGVHGHEDHQQQGTQSDHKPLRGGLGVAKGKFGKNTFRATRSTSTSKNWQYTNGRANGGELT